MRYEVVRCVCCRPGYKVYSRMIKRWAHQTTFFFLFVRQKRVREGLGQPQACRAGGVSAAHWFSLQVAAGKLAAATRLR